MGEHSAENDCPCGRGPGHVRIKAAGCTPNVENDAGCVECGKPVDRVLPNPIPEGYECMWSEAMTGRALYCLACYGVIPPGKDDTND